MTKKLLLAGAGTALAVSLVTTLAAEKKTKPTIDASKLPPASDKQGVTYAADVKPIFEKSCFKCHGGEKIKGGLDIGTREGPRIVPQVEKFRDVLLEKGWKLNLDLHFEIIEGAEHNELAWAQRVGPFLQFLYPAREPAV